MVMETIVVLSTILLHSKFKATIMQTILCIQLYANIMVSLQCSLALQLQLNGTYIITDIIWDTVLNDSIIY